MTPQKRIEKLIEDFLADRISRDEFIDGMCHKSVTKSELLAYIVSGVLTEKQTLAEKAFIETVRQGYKDLGIDLKSED